jgi:hypothetical protein
MQKCFYIAFLVFCFSARSEPVWQLYENKQGVSVYFQSYTDNTVEMKGEVVVNNVSAVDFLALLSDTDAAPRWIENVSKVNLIKYLSPSENLVYSYIDSPWPVANRDVITYSCYSQLTPQQNELVINARPNTLPVNKGVVRIATLNARWLLTQQNSNLQIIYQVYALPGGIVPTWLNNKVGLKSTYNTLINLRNILTSKKYELKKPIIKVGSCDNDVY